MLIVQPTAGRSDSRSQLNTFRRPSEAGLVAARNATEEPHAPRQCLTDSEFRVHLPKLLQTHWVSQAHADSTSKDTFPPKLGNRACRGRQGANWREHWPHQNSGCNTMTRSPRHVRKHSRTHQDGNAPAEPRSDSTRPRRSLIPLASLGSAAATRSSPWKVQSGP